MPGSASTSTFTKRTSSRSAASSSTIGSMTRHGGHQAAPKSTTTGTSLSRTWLSKWVASREVMAWDMPVTVDERAPAAKSNP